MSWSPAPMDDQLMEVVITEFDSQEKFFVLPSDQHPLLQSINTKLEEVSSQLADSEPLTLRDVEPLMPCVACYCSRWYRAIVISAMGDNSVCVYHMDYGTMDIVNLNEIRRMPDNPLIAATKPLTKACRLFGDLSQMNGDRLRNIITSANYRVWAKIEDQDEDTGQFIVTLYHQTEGALTSVNDAIISANGVYPDAPNAVSSSESGDPHQFSRQQMHQLCFMPRLPVQKEFVVQAEPVCCAQNEAGVAGAYALCTGDGNFVKGGSEDPFQDTAGFSTSDYWNCGVASGKRSQDVDLVTSIFANMKSSDEARGENQFHWRPKGHKETDWTKPNKTRSSRSKYSCDLDALLEGSQGSSDDDEALAERRQRGFNSYRPTYVPRIGDDKETAALRRVWASRLIRSYPDVQLPSPSSQTSLQQGVVTYVDSPSLFYVQMKSQQEKLQCLEAAMADGLANQQETIPACLVEPGTCCAVLCGKNSWKRGSVVSVEKDDLSACATVQLVDYGYEIRFPLESLKRLHVHYIKPYSRAVFKACLGEFAINEWTPLHKEALKSLILNQVLMVKVLSNDEVAEVKLTDLDHRCPDCYSRSAKSVCSINDLFLKFISAGPK